MTSARDKFSQYNNKNLRENRRGNDEWTIKRHWAHKTQHADRQKKNKYKTAQKTKFGSRILRNEEVNLYMCST